MNVKGDAQKIKDEGDKLQELLAKNDMKGVKKCVNEILNKLKKLESINDLLEKKNMDLTILNNKITAENKHVKEDDHEKIKAANKENKMLRARNTSLQDDVRQTKEDKEEVKTNLAKIVNFVDKFAEAVAHANTDDVETMLQSSLEEKDDDIGKLKKALRSLTKSHKFDDGNLKTKFDVTNGELSSNKNTMVKLAVSEGNSDVSNIIVSTNNEKLVSMEDVEMLVGRNVTGLKCRKGKGWKNLKVEEGMAHPPATGWGDREYMVVTEDEGGSVHLGQGCVSTPGQEKRHENRGREGPMFPPHVKGPRITTE